MTGYLTHDANTARLEQLHLVAEARRTVRTNAPAIAGPAEPISIRRATEADRAVLDRLAALDSSKALWGDVLIAEVGDEPRAAIEVASGATVADPFRPTAHLVDLLSLRATRLRQGSGIRRGLRLRLRSACRAA